jgi:hypothetical protein
LWHPREGSLTLNAYGYIVERTVASPQPPSVFTLTLVGLPEKVLSCSGGS